jgi:hypothetical protein
MRGGSKWLSPPRPHVLRPAPGDRVRSERVAQRRHVPPNRAIVRRLVRPSIGTAWLPSLKPVERAHAKVTQTPPAISVVGPGAKSYESAFAGFRRCAKPWAADDAPAAYSRLWNAAYGARVRSLPGQAQLAHALYQKTTPDQRSAAIKATDPHATFTIRLAKALAVPLHLKVPVAHPVVKSVRLSFTLEWVAAQWAPAVVVCLRHPLEVVASALDLKWDARPELIVQWKRPELRTRAAIYGVELPDHSDLVACGLVDRFANVGTP